MIILDTNILSELMKADPSPFVERWVGRLNSDVIWTTAICHAEILAGIAIMPEGRRKQGLLRSANSVFESLSDRLLPFDDTAAVDYATVMAMRKSAGRPIEPLDAMIAAIARAHAAAVATRNITDFTGCGIRLHDPWHDATLEA